MATVILTGGGTAGHVTPALALLPELRLKFDKIHFFGGNGIEKELAEAENVPFHTLPVVKLDRSHPLKNVKIPFVLTRGVREAKRLLRLTGADVVFSKGGYAALPTCLAARELGIPVVVHESDYTLGLANRLTAKFAAEVITSFAETEGGVFIGNPVRREIQHGSRARALSLYPIDQTKRTLLVFGGSLGAEALNTVVYKGLTPLTERYNVLHISGKSGDFSVTHAGYFQLKFSTEMPDLYALADLIVCRGGANTLAEVACLGKRALVVPLPKGNSRGDQLDNARSYEKRGYVEVLPQNELFVETLMAKLKLLEDKHIPVLDVSGINEKIVSIILKHAKQGRKID